MRRNLMIIAGEIRKQKIHNFHSRFVYFSLLLWPILGFMEVYYTYRPFSLSGNYLGITDGKDLLAFLATGYMAYTCFWSMVQNAWSMTEQERRGGTLEVTFLSPANRMAMTYGRAAGALIQQVWMFTGFCTVILVYTDSIHWDNLPLFLFILLLLVVSSIIWGGMLNAMLLVTRDGGIIMDFFEDPLIVFTGTRIPVNCFPLWAKVFAMIFPLTYCINIIRIALRITRDGQGWYPDAVKLLVSLAIMVVVTKKILIAAEKKNRKVGEWQFF